VSRHAGPPPDPSAPVVPEPTYAERARTLLHLGKTGVLSTLSRRHPGHPFGSVMPYALDARGHPLFLISTMAMHTQNLHADRRASLLVAEPGWQGDPLAAGRVTLMGEVTPLPAGDSGTAEARATYLARHPNAAYWVDFEDFGFHRLEVADVYFVGGFAAMDWVAGAVYTAARPDPLAEAAPGILEHMNKDHADALLTFARVLGGARDAQEATMVAVDRLGFRLRIRSGERLHAARIPFTRAVASAEETRAVLVAMLRGARARA
jgi:putative heme iron utilization protein